MKKEDQMTLSDRNNRLLLVITLIGGIFGSVGVITHWVKSSFRTIYIGRFPFGAEHLVGPIALGMEMVVACYGVFYLYSEAKTYKRFSNPEDELQTRNRADRNFSLLMNIIKYSFQASLVLFILLAILLNMSNGLWKTVVLIVVFTCLILLALLHIPYKGLKRFLSNILNPKYVLKSFKSLLTLVFKSNRIEEVITHSYVATTLWCFTIIVAFLIGLFSQQGDKSFLANFNTSKNMSIDLSFSNIEPTDLEVDILNGPSENHRVRKIYTLSHKDLMSYTSNVIVTGNTILTASPDHSMQDDLSDGQEILKKHLEVRPYLMDRQNYVVIKFIVVSDGIKKAYTFTDEVDLLKNTVTVTMSSIQQSL